MDFTPSIQHLAYREIEVEYIGEEAYDGQGFSQYPERRGWDKGRLLTGDFSQRPIEITASFLQDWLYFGLLFDCVGVAPKMEDFIITTESGKRVITAHLVPDYLLLWKQGLDLVDETEKRARLVSAAASLNTTWSVLLGAAVNDRPIPLSAEVILSITVLGSMLSRFHGKIQDFIAIRGIPIDEVHSDDFRKWETIHTPEFRATDDLCVNRMLQAGWCRSSIAKLRDSVTASTMYYASFFRRFPIRNDHTHCLNHQCLADTIDESSYHSAHVISDCDCHCRGPLPEALSATIQKGSIPLITVSEDEESRVAEIGVFEQQEYMPFVCISHVWSHGLGNTKENSLPECQLSKLQHLVNNVVRTLLESAFSVSSRAFPLINIPFWIDTLCIPVKGSERKSAISKIRSIYESACIVLVLDLELEHYEISNASTEEVLMRLASCSWMRRLWTLQEGVMAQFLVAKFADKFVDIKATYAKAVQEVRNIDYPYHTARVDLAWYIREFLLCHSQSNRLSRCEIIQYAWNAAEHRSTSKKADETIVLAGLIDYDIKDLLDKPEEMRLKIVLAAQSEFPQEILFLPGPRIQEDGYRWIVDSFTRSHIHTYTPGHPDPDGLLVSYPGFVSTGPPPRQIRNFTLTIIDPDLGRWATVGLKPSNPSEDILFAENMRLCLVLSSPLHKMGNGGVSGVLASYNRGGERTTTRRS